MINPVSFGSNLQADSSAKNLFDTPQKFQRTTPYNPDVYAPKKKKRGMKIALTVAALLAAAVGIAIGAKKGVFTPKDLAADAPFFKKALNTVSKGLDKAGNWMADNAGKAWTWAKGIFTKNSATPSA